MPSGPRLDRDGVSWVRLARGRPVHVLSRGAANPRGGPGGGPATGRALSSANMVETERRGESCQRSSRCGSYTRSAPIPGAECVAARAFSGSFAAIFRHRRRRGEPAKRLAGPLASRRARCPSTRHPDISSRATSRRRGDQIQALRACRRDGTLGWSVGAGHPVVQRMRTSSSAERADPHGQRILIRSSASR